MAQEVRTGDVGLKPRSEVPFAAKIWVLEFGKGK